MLDVELLGDGFDDEVAGGEFAAATGRVGLHDADAIEARLPGWGADLAFPGLAPQHRIAETACLVRSLGAGIGKQHRHPRLGGDLGDAAAHHAGADNPDGEVRPIEVEGHGQRPRKSGGRFSRNAAMPSF